MDESVSDFTISRATKGSGYEREDYSDVGTLDEEDLNSVAPIADGVATESIPLPFRTAADVANAVPEVVDWIAHGFVAPGVVTEIDGKLKASGKTTFLGAFPRAALTGGRFLGHDVAQSRVLWLTEERPATFAETLKRANLADTTDLEVLHWHEVKALPWPVVMNGAITRAQQIGARVVIVDTIGQWGGLRGDAENSNGAQLDAVEPLQDAAARTGRHRRAARTESRRRRWRERTRRLRLFRGRGHRGVHQAR